MQRKRLVRVLEASVKQTPPHCVRYKKELIYIQFRMKGQGSQELGLENRKETKNDILQFFYTPGTDTHWHHHVRFYIQ